MLSTAHTHPHLVTRDAAAASPSCQRQRPDHGATRRQDPTSRATPAAARAVRTRCACAASMSMSMSWSPPPPHCASCSHAAVSVARAALAARDPRRTGRRARTPPPPPQERPCLSLSLSRRRFKRKLSSLRIDRRAREGLEQRKRSERALCEKRLFREREGHEFALESLRPTHSIDLC